MNLTGLFLADNYASNLTQWAFPNGSSIAPGQFKVIFADIERDMAQQRARLAARPKDAPLELTETAR